MDVAHPSRALIPTLEGPILEVLSRTTGPLTGHEVYRLTGTGSANGVRLALARLVRQGVVLAEERARAVFYLLNRDHVTWTAVSALANLRRSMIDRLVGELRSWEVQPLHASMFGSAARGDGDADSDIDILLLRPEALDEDQPPWADQVDRLRSQVPRWTGNHCQIFQLDVRRLGEHVIARDPLVDEWRRDAILLAGDELRLVLRRLPATGDDR